MPARGKTSRASVALLCTLFLIVLVRAKTQSLTVDEARTFALYVSKPLSEMAAHYDACNHVLHTLLTKFFVQALGSSELVLRLGSVVGCLLYFTAVYRLARGFFGEHLLQFASVAALTLNPLVLDFCVAARGYGLALGLLFWTGHWILRAVQEAGHPRLLRHAGVLAGLTVAANLTCLIPICAFGCILLVCSVRDRFWRRMDHFIGPALAVAFVLLILPLARVEKDTFYVGYPQWTDSVTELLNESLVYSSARSWGVPPQPLLIAVLVGLVLASGLASFRILRGEQTGLPLALFGGSLALSVVGLTLLHLLANVPYPVGRTGLYLIPLFTITLALASDLWPSSIGPRVGSVVLILLAAAYTGQMDVRFFTEWRFDASTKWMMRKLEEDYRGRKLTGPAELAATWALEPSANYYRKRHRLRWLQEVKRQDVISSQPFEYYLLFGSDISLVDKLHLKVLFRDDLSGTVLAART